jgi:ABC-2 type transport system ATP-binding protein
MSTDFVATRGLTKTYKEITALDRVDLAVGEGSVYGLIGPNGAGKTTMLGILAGLRKPSSGEVQIATVSVGVVPDTPLFDKWLTGREVVELSRTLAGERVPNSAVDDVLEVAGLSDAAHRKVTGYSRGMLQRLGLAAAVVNQPDLLLLDEPAAALDPGGRREVLDLVAALRGRSTVLFSSHILDDVQEVCDTIGILRRGELMYQGSLSGLLSRYGSTNYLVAVRGTTEAVVSALGTQEWVASVDTTPSGELRIAVRSLGSAEKNLVSVLAACGAPIVSIVPDQPSLERVFLEVTR